MKYMGSTVNVKSFQAGSVLDVRLCIYTIYSKIKAPKIVHGAAAYGNYYPNAKGKQYL